MRLYKHFSKLLGGLLLSSISLGLVTDLLADDIALPEPWNRVEYCGSKVIREMPEIYACTVLNKDTELLTVVLKTYQKDRNDSLSWPIKGMTVFMTAAFVRCAECIDVLMNEGINIAWKNESEFDDLTFANRKDGLSNINDQMEGAGITALAVAAGRGDLNTMKALIRHGARVDTRFADGSTALIQAVWEERVTAAGFLLDQGADVNIQYNEGVSALMLAATKNSQEMLHTLIEYGASLSMKDESGLRAYEYALIQGNYHFALICLEDKSHYCAKVLYKVLTRSAATHELIACFLVQGINAVSHILDTFYISGPVGAVVVGRLGLFYFRTSPDGEFSLPEEEDEDGDDDSGGNPHHGPFHVMSVPADFSECECESAAVKKGSSVAMGENTSRRNQEVADSESSGISRGGIAAAEVQSRKEEEKRKREETK